MLVREVMTTPVVSAHAETSLKRGVKSVPVLRSGRVVGMISGRDVIAVLARRDALIEAEVDEARAAGVVTVDTRYDGSEGRD